MFSICKTPLAYRLEEYISFIYGQIQRISTYEMVHEIEMVEHHSTISSFTCNIYLDFFEQVLSFFLQVGSRDIFLPDNTFV